VIYFLRCEKDTDLIEAGWIKIGTTTRLSARLRKIAADLGHMPTVLAILDGAFAEERALHGKFEFARKYGEWFYPYPELLQLIETDGRPWDGIDEQETVTTTIRCRKEYRDWLNEFARKERLTPTQLIDFGLVELARLKKNPLPPDR
jgi:hypothetical protein